MNSIAVIDTASAVVFLAALFCSARIPERGLDERSRRLMMAGLGIYVFVCISNVLEHSGVTTALDYYEDYAEILFLPVILVFIYSVILNRETIRRKRGERDLLESESRMRSLLSALPDLIFRIDREGTFLDFSAGRNVDPIMPPDEFIGRKIDSIFPEALSAKARHAIHEALETGEIQVFEYQLPQDDGPMDFESRIVASGANEVTAVVRDVTEQKEAAASLQQAKEELERQYEELKKIDRVKDSLLRDVAHELKTPVAKHAMQLEILKPIITQHKLTESESRALKIMEESVRRQQSVIRNLLNLARLEEGGRSYHRETMWLDEVVGAVMADYADLAERNNVTLTIDAPPVEISSDAEMLWHLFSNLVSNAIKFRKTDGQATVKISAEKGPDGLTVRVADNGIGLSELEKTRIFDRFFQGTASTEGSGVGLTICRMIAEGLGGSIAIKSAGKGAGTEVTVNLPG